MKILGISGKIGTGKSTLAELLAAMTPGAIRISYADALREEVAEHFGFDLGFVRSQEFKEREFMVGLEVRSGRQLLQWWGTNVRRAADPDYWTHKMRHRLLHLSAVGHPLAIIDDVRMPNERDLINRMGGQVIRLEPYDGWQPGPGADHYSETALDGLEGFSWIVRPGYGRLDLTAASIVEDFIKTHTEGAIA